jgi:predicted transposase/invertase (TIGR01784 family)
MIDHDELFKKLLTTFFEEFIELFLPEVAKYIDCSEIVFLPQEYFADTTSGERRKIDILAKVKFRGQDACFLMHIENQSYGQEYFDRRMLFYFTKLYQTYLLPIYPVAVFSFDYPLKTQSQQHTVTFPDLKVLEFNFATIQLNKLHWRDFLQHRNPVAAALMAKMRIDKADRPKVKAECLRALATLQLDPARTELISGFVDTYLNLNPTEEQTFQAEIDRMQLTEQEQIMEIVTSWMERGMERGIERGVEQGTRHQTEALILRQLNHRFNQIAEPVQQRIRTLSLSQLEALSEALLDFSNATDLTNWLAQRQN